MGVWGDGGWGWGVGGGGVCLGYLRVGAWLYYNVALGASWGLLVGVHG